MSGIAWAYEGARKYGEYKYKYGHKAAALEPNYMAALVIVWAIFGVVVFYIAHTYWDEIEAIWNSIFNRNAVRSVTVVIKGTKVDSDKIKSLTKDVNGLLNGKILDIVEKKHRINAKKVIGMSVTPGYDCLMFTTWYKR